MTEGQILVRDNWDHLLKYGWQKLKQQTGNKERITLADAIQLFMKFQTQEDALPVMTVAYSIANINTFSSEDRDMSKLVIGAMIQRFNTLN